MLSKLKMIDGREVCPKIFILDKEEMVCLKLDDYDAIVGQLLAEHAVLRFVDNTVGTSISDFKKVILGLLGVAKEHNIPAEVLSRAQEITANVNRNDEGKGTTLGEYLRQIAYEDIKKARKDKGWTQEDLTKRIPGLTQSQLSRLEANPGRAPVELLSKLAAVLGVDIVITGNE